MQVGFIHVKILSSHVYDSPIDLHTINWDRPIRGCKLTHGSSTSQPNDCNFAHLILCKWRIVEIRRNHEIIPGTLSENTAGIVNRMNTHALVQDQLRLITHLNHLNIVVDRLPFSHQYSPAIAAKCRFNWPLYSQDRQRHWD